MIFETCSFLNGSRTVAHGNWLHGSSLLFRKYMNDSGPPQTKKGTHTVV